MTAPTRKAIAIAGSPGLAGWTLGVSSWLAAVGFPLIFFLLRGVADAPPAGLIAVTVLLLLYSSTRLAILIGSGQPKIVAGVFWLFMYVAMSVVPLAQIHTGLYPFLMDRNDLPVAQALALSFAVAVDVGYIVSTRRSADVSGTWNQPQRIVSDGRLKLISAAAVLASAYYIRSVGSLTPFFSSRSDLGDSLVSAGLRSAESQAGSAIVVSLGSVPVLIAFISCTVRLHRRPELRRRIGTWVWGSLLLVINLIVNNPISNARYWFLTVVAGVVISLPRFGRRSFACMLIGGALMAVVAFPYSDYFRNSTELRGSVRTSSIATTISTKDYDQSIMTANGVWWVDQVGHTYGQQVAGSLLFWVPRSMWKGKSVDTGVAIGRAMAVPNVNLSSPLWLELYVDGGWPAAVLVGLLLGAVAHRADQTFAHLLDPNRRDALVLEIALPLLAGYSFILLRGPLLQSMPRLSVILAVSWFLGGSRVERVLRRADPISEFSTQKAALRL